MDRSNIVKSDTVLICKLKSENREQVLVLRDERDYSVGFDQSCDYALDHSSISRFAFFLKVLKVGSSFQVFLKPVCPIYRAVRNAPFPLRFNHVIKWPGVRERIQVGRFSSTQHRDREYAFHEELQHATKKIMASFQGSGQWPVCYICSATFANAELEDRHCSQDEQGGRQSISIINTSPISESGLVTSPCGICSGSVGYVHVDCLLEWIVRAGLGSCPNCKCPLPSKFSPDPPDIELRVHKSPQLTDRPRIFRTAFRGSSNESSKYIELQSGGSLSLAPSISPSTLACLSFDEDSGDFLINDPSGTTFVDVKDIIKLENLADESFLVDEARLSLHLFEADES